MHSQAQSALYLDVLGAARFLIGPPAASGLPRGQRGQLHTTSPMALRFPPGTDAATKQCIRAEAKQLAVDLERLKAAVAAKDAPRPAPPAGP